MEEVKVGNKMVKARQYPWGTVQGKHVQISVTHRLCFVCFDPDMTKKLLHTQLGPLLYQKKTVVLGVSARVSQPTLSAVAEYT